MAGHIATFRNSVKTFFFKKEIPYGIAVLRILLPLILLGLCIQRWTHTRVIYSTDGATSQLSLGYGWGSLMPEFSGTIAVAIHTTLMIALFFSSIGFKTRLSLGLSTILYTYISMLDSISTMTKYSVISTHVLFLLTLSHCGAIWSVDAWLRKRKAARNSQSLTDEDYTFEIWPQRLIQLLLSVVYLGAAITKLHTQAFFSGEQLKYWMVTQSNWNHPLGELLSMFPVSLIIMAYLTVIWEILFIFYAWNGLGRIVMLGTGIVFHIMTALTLGLYVFPMICISIYWSFLKEGDVVSLRAWLKNRRSSEKPHWLSRLGTQTGRMFEKVVHPFQVPSRFVYSALLVLGVCLGVFLEFQLDLYGERRAEGPYKLKSFDADLARTMLAPEEPVRRKDFVYSFNVGTTLIGGAIVNRKQDFEYGENAVVQCVINPPHEDVWIECNLHNQNDVILDRVGTVLRREQLRCNFTYPMNQHLPAGEYDLVLTIAGEEITRRTIRLHGESSESDVMGN